MLLTAQVLTQKVSSLRLRTDFCKIVILVNNSISFFRTGEETEIFNQNQTDFLSMSIL